MLFKSTDWFMSQPLRGISCWLLHCFGFWLNAKISQLGEHVQLQAAALGWLGRA